MIETIHYINNVIYCEYFINHNDNLSSVFSIVSILTDHYLLLINFIKISYQALNILYENRSINEFCNTKDEFKLPTNFFFFLRFSQIFMIFFNFFLIVLKFTTKHTKSNYIFLYL